MKKRRRFFGALLTAAALVIMTLPVSEADAAASASVNSSASANGSASANNANPDFLMDGTTLVKYRGREKNVSIPEYVEVIGGSAFEDNTNVELVVIPNSVERIDPYAFWGCDNLDTVVLGRGLTGVGDYAFAGCKGLEEMSLPANIRSIGVQAFADCVNMTDISIPAETLYIHDTAFDGCAKLTIHCDPGTAADVYAQAFYERQKEMPEYEDVPNYQPGEVPDPGPDATPTPVPTPGPEPVTGNVLGSTSVVGNQAVVFVATEDMNVLSPMPPSGVSGASADSVMTDIAGVLGNMISAGPVQGIPKYTVVDGRIVADQAFYRSDSLEAVALKDGITEIGQFAFARSTLREIQIPEGVTDICYGAFYHCDGLESVTMPSTIRNVEPKAFAHTALVENFNGSGTDFLVVGDVLLAYNGSDSQVFVPGGIRVIAAEVFAGHGEIQSVRLPDSVVVVGEAAFEGCTGLSQVNLGAGVEQIKDRAFADCGSLETVKVPASVQTVGLRPFGDAQVIYNGRQPEETYEISATRLSNEDFRDVEQESAQPGVNVVGIEPATARLEGASRSYTLKVDRQTDTAQVETAWQRAFGDTMPENMAVYDLQMTDNSGIPLTKLGHSGLTVVIPLPENLRGQELKMVTLDRNGQLEAISVERVLLEGTECFQFRTTHLSLFGVYGVGASQSEIREVSVYMNSMSAGPAEPVRDTAAIRLLKYIIGAAMLITGLALFLSGVERRRA